MITSYFGVTLASQLVFQYNMTNVSHLIGFGFGAHGLQVKNLLHPVPPKDVMASFYSLSKTQSREEVLQVGKTDVRVGRSAQNLLQNFVG
jgi:hypothetical protein